MEKLALEYYCGNCNCKLEELDCEVNRNLSNFETCPYCGILIGNSLQKRLPISVTRPKPVFQKASEIPRLTFDILKIDSIVSFLTIGQKICLVGKQSQRIVERLCVRAQLPQRYGGLDSNVLLIDGANSSDLYQCISFAQQYSLDVRKVLNRIITSRAFTVYQLANVIINELESAISRFDTKVVVITNLLHYFTNDQYLDKNEMQSLLQQIATVIKKIQNCLVIVSLESETEYDHILSGLFYRTIKIANNYHRIHVDISDSHNTNSILMKKSELITVPLH